MSKLLVSCITDLASARAVIKILKKKIVFNELIIGFPLWEKLRLEAQEPGGVYEIEGIRFYYVQTGATQYLIDKIGTTNLNINHQYISSIRDCK